MEVVCVLHSGYEVDPSFLVDRNMLLAFLHSRMVSLARTAKGTYFVVICNKNLAINLRNALQIKAIK